MNELHLFAGVGGGILASRLLGHDIKCAVENNPYCINVLCTRQNEGVLEPFPIWDDIRTFNGADWKGHIDLVSGGFPCQAFSSAARGRNINEKDLWEEMYRVIQEVEPRFVFAENVSRKPIEKALQDLEEIGYVGDFIKLSAKDLGADHIRSRCWLLAYSNNNGEFCSTEYAEASILQKLCNGVWETFPGELRVSDGMAYRVDRLKAAGNGQVSIVAAVAFSILMKKLLT